MLTEGVILAIIAAVSGGGLKFFETRSAKQIAEIQQKATKELETLKREIEFYKSVSSEKDKDNDELQAAIDRMQERLEEAQEAEERYRKEYWAAVEDLSRFKVIVLKSLEKSGLSLEELETILKTFENGD